MLVEPKPGPMEKGQADGISVRSMEMFQAFGFGETVMRESVWINETTFWTPGSDSALARVARVQDVPDGTSEMPHVLINQARVHDMFLDVMKHSPTRLAPDYGLKVARLTIDPRAADHPVSVTLEHTAPGREGETVTVRANYVIGCDGARSNVRSAIGGALHGDARAPSLGRDGPAGGDRLPGLAHEVLRALEGRRHPDGVAARGRAPRAPVCRA